VPQEGADRDAVQMWPRRKAGHRPPGATSRPSQSAGHRPPGQDRRSGRPAAGQDRRFGAERSLA